MPVSQNGWPANNPALEASQLVPGTLVKISVRKDAAGQLLLEVASAYDRLVQDIDNARGGLDDWGYAERPVRGGSDLSNHASGTAIDLNATKHGLGTAPTSNYTAAQINQIHRILAVCGGVVRWGGDYGDPAHGGVRGSRPDGMHFEINDGQTLASCAKALAAMRQFNAGQLPIGPTEEPDMTPEDRAMLTEVRDLLRWTWSQLAGENAKPFEFTGWPTFEGGTDERLTLVDYLRRSNEQQTKLITALTKAQAGEQP